MSLDHQTFFKIKVKQFQLGGLNTSIFQISDVSEKVLYDITIGEKRLLEHINSIVSHEMRNPLNAIQC